MKLLLVVIVAAVACAGVVSASELTEEVLAKLTRGEGHHIAKDNHHHWNYIKQGADWPGICKTGKRQSPINIRPHKVKTVSEDAAAKWRLSFNYKKARKLSMGNNGHTIIVNANDKLGYVKSKGRRYNVKQFHFHSPSEHSIDGRHFHGELHIVHQLEDAENLDDLLVVGVFLEVDTSRKANSFLKSINLHKAPKLSKDKYTIPKVSFDKLKEVLKGGFYAYKGSLTTPPCTESVSWRVFSTPLVVSQSQIDVLNNFYSRNNAFAHGLGNVRKLMTLGTRKIRYVPGEEDEEDEEL